MGLKKPMGRPPKDPDKLRDYKAALKAWEAHEQHQDEAKAAKKAGRRPGKSAAAEKPAKPKPGKGSKGKDGSKKERQGGTTKGEPTPNIPGSQEKNLSAADLPAIITLFQSLGISRLIGAGFDIRLTAATENRDGERMNKPGLEGATAHSANPPLTVEVDQEALRDMEMSQKLIDSPLEYEQAQIDAHLGQDDGGHEQHQH